MKMLKTASGSGARHRLEITSLLVAVALVIFSAASSYAADMSGRYAIESATHAGQYLRGLPEQGKEVVTAKNPQATVLLVKAEKGDVYSLQSHSFFLSLEGGHNAVMHKANGSREKFKIVENKDGTHSLQAVWNKKYLTIDDSGEVHSSDELNDNAKLKLHKK